MFLGCTVYVCFWVNSVFTRLRTAAIWNFALEWEELSGFPSDSQTGTGETTPGGCRGDVGARVHTADPF